MPYNPSLVALLETPAIRRIKKLDLTQQREFF
ncbi:alpha/beta hydrolase, partial [Francisella tularensis subsp. holarctica]|nr:alpha/beta hydrolase [Francisella tularensis subsp. holarctica]